MLTVGAEELHTLLPVARAVDTLERAFADRAAVRVPLREHVPCGEGELLLMPAASDTGAGVKLVTINPANPPRGRPLVSGLYALFAEDLTPAAVFDAAALTALRTAAVSALATRCLARADASRLVVFGAGVQAAAHVTAMRAVRPVRHVYVVGRSPQRARRLAEEVAASGLPAEVAPPSAVAEADIVCACTTSRDPVFDGAELADGAHVNAIGSYQPHAREVDDETVRRARLVVEDREAVFAETGDVIIPLGRGVLRKEDVVADLAEIVRGEVPGGPVRRDDRDITLFESVGLAVEDLVLARAAYEARLA